jgi:hypothetical protein
VLSAKQSTIDLQNQLTTTVDALGELTSDPEPDLKAKFSRFSGELDRAQGQASRSRGRVVGVQTQGEKYFSQWDAEIATIGNAEIKARSQARRTASLTNFRAFAGEHDAAREAVSTLLASMTDIRKHLSADMTPAGVDAIRDIADRTRVQLSEALQRLGSVAGQLDRIDGDLSPGMISADGSTHGSAGDGGGASGSNATATVDTTK